MDTSRSFSNAEWALLRIVADGLGWSYGWTPAAAQRLRFVLDFAYGTGLRASELVHATLGAIEVDHEKRWLHVVGRGIQADPRSDGARWMAAAASKLAVPGAKYSPTPAYVTG